MRNIFMKMGEAASEFQEKVRQAPKTKKQLEKEAKKQALEALQNKSLHTIYKQLARVLHPDLERDPEKRIFKEELMKKLTAAYDKDDLFALLQIEMEWMSHSVDAAQAHNDADIKLYNAILKEQVAELEMATAMLIMHPRYAALQKFYEDDFDGIATLRLKHMELEMVLKQVQKIIDALAGSRAKKAFEDLVETQRREKQMEATRRKVSSCSCGMC